MASSAGPSATRELPARPLHGGDPHRRRRSDGHRAALPDADQSLAGAEIQEFGIRRGGSRIERARRQAGRHDEVRDLARGRIEPRESLARSQPERSVRVPLDGHDGVARAVHVPRPSARSGRPPDHRPRATRNNPPPSVATQSAPAGSNRNAVTCWRPMPSRPRAGSANSSQDHGSIRQRLSPTTRVPIHSESSGASASAVT